MDDYIPTEIERNYDALPEQATKALYIHLMHFYQALYPTRNDVQHAFIENIAFQPSERIARSILIDLVTSLDLIVQTGDAAPDFLDAVRAHPNSANYMGHMAIQAVERQAKAEDHMSAMLERYSKL